MVETVYLSLGSNIGERIINLEMALKAISLYPRTIIKTISKVYETEPVGFKKEDKQVYFLNMCCAIDTSLDPFELLYLTQETENKLGRQKIKSIDNKIPRMYHSRIIDIDLLIFGKRIIYTKDLIIPHPALHERNFVLEPLCDIADDTIHPLLRLPMKTLRNTLKDKYSVKIFSKQFSNNFLITMNKANAI